MAAFEPSGDNYNPGKEDEERKALDFIFLTDNATKEFIRSHGRVIFIIRGPPGTAKATLSSLLLDCYPSSVICSANQYFDDDGIYKARSKEVLQLAHDFCRMRVAEECEKNSHPVIVQNSHVRTWETQPYTRIAAKYGYTVIMAITLRKFHVDDQVLEKTNRKGLNKTYLSLRLKQWEEYIPLYLGWFPRPDDASFLLSQGKQALVALTGDGKFCKVFDAYCEEEILQYFTARRAFFFIAAYLESKRDKKNLYLSTEVQSAYGKSFEISVQGFLISKSFLLAVASLCPVSKRLLSTLNRESKKIKNYLLAFENMSAEVLENMSFTATSESATLFEKVCDFKEQSVRESEWENDENMSVHDLTLIVLAEAKENAELITDAHQFLSAAFSDMANSEGLVPISEFLELDDGTRYARLSNGTWFVQAAQKMQVSTVFTGLYI